MRKIVVLVTLLFSIFVAVVSLAQNQTMPLVYDVKNTGAGLPKPPLPLLNQLPSISYLPNPFLWASDTGSLIKYRSDWRKRRAEIGAQIQNYEIGQKPPRPDTITASYTHSDDTLRVYVTVNGQTLTLKSKVVRPTGTGPFPAVIGMNSPSGSVPSSIFTTRNIAEIPFMHNQVTTYGGPQNTDPFYRLYGPALNVDSSG